MKEIQNNIPISQTTIPMFPREIKKDSSCQIKSDYSLSDQKIKKCFSPFCDCNPLNQDYRRQHRPQEPIQLPPIQNQPFLPLLIPRVQNLIIERLAFPH